MADRPARRGAVGPGGRRRRRDAWPTASSSPRGRSGAPTARSCSRTSRPSGPTGSAPTARSASSASETGAANGQTFAADGRIVFCEQNGRRVSRMDARRLGRRDGRRDLVGQAAEQPQRHRLPLRRPGLLHRPALRRAARGPRAPLPGRLPPRPGRAARACWPTTSRSPTAWPSRPTSGRSTSATPPGITSAPSTSSPSATSRPARAGSSPRSTPASPAAPTA